MVDEEFALQMVVLVLEHACKKTIEPLVMRLQLLVEICDVYSLGTTHVFVDAWHTEATFLHRLGVLTGLNYGGVDICMQEIFVLRHVVAQGVEVDYKQT